MVAMGVILCASVAQADDRALTRLFTGFQDCNMKLTDESGKVLLLSVN